VYAFALAGANDRGEHVGDHDEPSDNHGQHSHN
jgi:hypothetical protein